MRQSISLQAGLRSICVNDTELKALMGGEVRWYDYTVELAQAPYITYIEDNIAELDTTTELGFTHTVSFHVWSEYEGTKEVRQIMDRLYQLFHNLNDLVIELGSFVLMEFKFMDIVRDPDGQTYHGVARFIVITEES